MPDSLIPVGAALAIFPGILPRTVESAEADRFLPVAEIPRADLAQVARAVPSRQREFATGRALARAALARLGIGACDLPRGEDRAPVWPEGATGSITHCCDYAAAAVSRPADVAALGIDIEQHQALPDGIVSMVMTSAEVARAAGLDREVHWDRVTFSAKESVYKAWAGLTGRWLDFHDVTLEFSPGSGDFRARVSPEKGGPHIMMGSFAVSGRHVATSAIVWAGQEPL